MRLEKKITTGNALNAKLIIASWYPTPGMNELKRKSLPLSEKLIRVLKILSTKKNCDFTKGTFRITNPKNACNPNPQNIVLSFIPFRLLERLYAIRSKAIMPKNPVYIIIYSF